MPADFARILFLWPLGTVLGTTGHAFLNACRVVLAADDVIFNTRQIFDPAATHQNHGVLGQVVTFTHDVGGDLLLVT